MPIYTVWKQWRWVLLFFILCLMFYENGAKERTHNYRKLQAQYQDLLEEEKKALQLKQDYTLQINSQSDPEWIELTLMKGLGLVPEGQIKVVFKNKPLIAP